MFLHHFKLIKSLLISGLFSDTFSSLYFQFAFNVLIYLIYLDVCTEIQVSIQLQPFPIFLNYKLLEGRVHVLFIFVDPAACSTHTVVSIGGVNREDERSFERGSIF